MKTNLDRILCAIDFSKFSSSILDLATVLARKFTARITVFHTLSFPRTPLEGDPSCRQGTADLEQVSKTHARIDSLMADRRVSWEAVVRCGNAVDAIVDYTAANDIGIVMAASYGLSGWKRFLLGTVVESLSRTLNRPLLVVRPPRKKGLRESEPGRPRLKNILICCDLSSNISSFYPYAEKFARGFEAKLHFVHAMETPVQEDDVDPTSAPYSEIQQSLQERMHDRLRQQIFSDFIHAVPTITAVIPGNPTDSLQDYATVHAIDLIMVGVRRRGSIHKALIGSTTESMIRHAPCDVLTIPVE